MGLTNYGERKVFELLKGVGTYYIGLLTTAPTDSDLGVEVTGGAYARQAFPASDPTTDSNGETTVKNTAAIEFPTATADWGTPVAWGLYDAATGGNLVWYGAFTTPKAFSANDTCIIHANEFVLSVD